MNDKENALVTERHKLLFKEIPAADGSKYGVRVVGYIEETDDYLVVDINWLTRELINQNSEPYDIDAYKLSYRYCPDNARNIGKLTWFPG